MTEFMSKIRTHHHPNDSFDLLAAGDPCKPDNIPVYTETLDVRDTQFSS